MYLLLSLFLFSFIFSGYGQQLTTLPIGGSKKAIVSEYVGLAKITLQYHRPGVKGREGMIWGGLVHEGFIPLGLSTEPSPWRAGANENTVIEVTTRVLIEGKPLEAGKYVLLTIRIAPS